MAHPVYVNNVAPSKADARSRTLIWAADATEVRSTDYQGAFVLYVKSLQDIFERDTADTTTADNGTTCIVGPNGERWKVADVDPGSPEIAFQRVRVVATANVVIATALENGDSLDGVTLATGDLVLLTAQSTTHQNGVYVVPASGAASRHPDFDAYDDYPGSYFSVMEGTTKADTLWRCTSNRGGTLGSTSIVISEAGVADGDKGDITVASGGTAWTVDADAITYAKMQNVSATDRLLGRSTSGAGNVEEITCTAAGRAILDDADAAAQRATLNAPGLSVDNFFTGAIEVFVDAPGIEVRRETNAAGGAALEFHRGRVGPAAVQSGDRLAEFMAQGYDGTSYNATLSCGVRMFATENFTTGARGSRIEFLTTATGTTTRATRLTAALGIYGVGQTDMGIDSINFAGVYEGGLAVTGLKGSATYDPPSLADGAGATTTVTVTGAALGDFAIASFSLDLQGITVTAWVSATNTVSVRFQNESGGILDLGSGTLRARVFEI